MLLSVGAAEGKRSSGRFCVTQRLGHSSQEINTSKKGFIMQFPDQGNPQPTGMWDQHLNVRGARGWCSSTSPLWKQRDLMESPARAGPHSHTQSGPGRGQTNPRTAPTGAHKAPAASPQHSRHLSHSGSQALTQESAAWTIILCLCETLFH